MEPQSTALKKQSWRIWHGVNYFIGGGTFLVGSILLFPMFRPYLDTDEVSGWLYTIGSGTFLLADFTQWLHYLNYKCTFCSYAINFFVNVIGSLLYLIGSACFIPAIGMLQWGMNLFIAGSTFIYVAQIWKIWRVFSVEDKKCQDIYKEDPSGFWVDLFAGLGGFMYFSGTFVFKQAGDSSQMLNLAALIYSFGGLFFFTSGAFIQKRYFWEKSSQKIQYKDSQSVVSTEI